MCNDVITNTAKVSYSSFDGSISTIYSNEVITNVVKKCQCFSFCINSCINLCEILCTPYFVIDIDTSASIVKSTLVKECGKYILELKICLTQIIYYKENNSCQVKCYTHRKYINHSIDVCNNFCDIDDIYVSAYCEDYCINNSNKLLINSILKICKY